MTESGNFCISVSGFPPCILSPQRSPDGFTLDLYEGTPRGFSTRGGGNAGVSARVAQLNRRRGEKIFETVKSGTQWTRKAITALYIPP